MIVEKKLTPREEFFGKLDLINNFGEDYNFNLVLPGDLISKGEGLIQGSGTYEQNGAIYSSLVGYISKTNKLVSVKPIKSRYKAKVGDIVVGRVTEIMNKKWKVDINSTSSAQLHLNAVKLPEIQRRKTEEDERQMRMFLSEGDLVLAEVQAISSMDKTVSLHIRNDKFGKLEGGCLLELSHDLVKKQTRHMVDLSMGIKLILGVNGSIWIEPIDPTDEDNFDKISKLRNILSIFEEGFIGIRVSDLLAVYSLVGARSAHEILEDELKSVIYDKLAELINENSKENLADIISNKK